MPLSPFPFPFPFKNMSRISPHIPHCLRLGLIGLCALLVGCGRPHEGVKKAYEGAIKTGWKEQIELQKLGLQGERVLNWEQALALMLEQNIDLIRARRSLKRTKDEVDNVLRNYLPGLTGNMNTPNLLDVSSFSFKDLQFNVYTLFSFPNPKQVFTSLYTNKLSYLGAIMAYDLQLRQKHTELFRLFLDYEQFELKKQKHKWKRKLAEKSLQIDEFKGQRLMKEVEKEAYELLKEELKSQNTIGRFFGSENLRWVLVQEGMPTFDYLNHPLDIEDPDKVGQRALQLTALDLERTRLYRRGIKARYWPEYPSINISLPTLFHLNQDTKTKKVTITLFDSGSSSVTLNSSWTLDTHRNIKKQLEEHDFEQELRVKDIKRKAQELIQNLLHAMEGLKLLDRQRRYLEFRQKAHSAAMAQAKAMDPDALIKESLTIKDAALQLKRAQADVHMFFWIVDESRWPSFTFDTYVMSDPNSKGKKLRRPKVL